MPNLVIYLHPSGQKNKIQGGPNFAPLVYTALELATCVQSVQVTSNWRSGEISCPVSMLGTTTGGGVGGGIVAKKPG